MLPRGGGVGQTIEHRSREENVIAFPLNVNRSRRQELPKIIEVEVVTFELNPPHATSLWCPLAAGDGRHRRVDGEVGRALRSKQGPGTPTGTSPARRARGDLNTRPLEPQSLLRRPAGPVWSVKCALISAFAHHESARCRCVRAVSVIL
jgi:hypothetical protein